MLHFVVEEASPSGFAGRATSTDIFIEADTVPELYAQARDAVRCHFEPKCMPGFIWLHIACKGDGSTLGCIISAN